MRAVFASLWWINSADSTRKQWLCQRKLYSWGQLWVHEGARLEKVLPEKKLELLKSSIERKLNAQRIKLENEITEAEDEADFARTKEQLVEQLEEIRLKIEGWPTIAICLYINGRHGPDLYARHVKTSTDTRSQLLTTNEFLNPPPVPSTLRRPFMQPEPIIHRRDVERFPVTPVRPRESLPYCSDMTPSPLGDLTTERGPRNLRTILQVF